MKYGDPETEAFAVKVLRSEHHFPAIEAKLDPLIYEMEAAFLVQFQPIISIKRSTFPTGI